MSPSQSEHALLQDVRRNLETNQVQAALVVCRTLNSQFPRSAEGWCAASAVAGKLNNLSKSLEFADRALILDPENARFLIAKANLLIVANRIPEALALAQQARDGSGGNAVVLDMAGTLFSRCGDHASAQSCYESALKLAPENGAIHYNLAAVQRFLGDYESAEASWDKVLALNPADYDALHLRSDVRTQTKENNHVDELEAILARGVPDWLAETKVCFALAKEYEDIEEYEKSFASLKRGADLRRHHMTYKVENDLDTIDKIIDVFASLLPTDEKAGFGNDDAIFIVGMPRTGTTLVDRILSSHADVISAGELNNFALQMTRLTNEQAGRKLERMELIENAAALDFSELGRRYIGSTQGIVGEGTRFIDKLPLNFLYCGLIHRALPKAKIINVARNPIDTCYAMYKRLFKDAYPMSYNLDDLGRYFLAYQKLMQHWQKSMPGVIHTMSYEDLVSNQEECTRRLLEYCELDWQDSCLQFDKNQAPTTTASATQVRQPIYHSSIQKWRHYETQLEPLLEILRAGGVA